MNGSLLILSLWNSLSEVLLTEVLSPESLLGNFPQERLHATLGAILRFTGAPKEAHVTHRMKPLTEVSPYGSEDSRIRLKQALRLTDVHYSASLLFQNASMLIKGSSKPLQPPWALICIFAGITWRCSSFTSFSLHYAKHSESLKDVKFESYTTVYNTLHTPVQHTVLCMQLWLEGF